MLRRHCGPCVAAFKRFRLIIVAALVLAAGGAAVAATSNGTGRIGPGLRVTGNGRLLSPPGTLVTLGHFPTGGALTPDGLVLLGRERGAELRGCSLDAEDLAARA